MATYDLEEQEQIDALKHFWRDYGRLIIAAVVAFIVGVGGTQGWKHYKRTQAEQASLEFVKLEEAVGKGDVNEIRNVAQDIITEYASTAYAQMAALVVAQTEREAGDLDAAAQRLEWVVDTARTEEVQLLARLRLAAVLLDQDEYDAALQLLDHDVTEAFVGAYADLRGDVLVAQGKAAEARAQYEQALEQSRENSAWRDVVQLKLDALSSE
ncbi:MAG: tetratricopeptide repeat protein [Betaproteobacteria bacterium]|nr:MAG: tetratricopeptide repeat protein [Betaproteobacteria bacterium]